MKERRTCAIIIIIIILLVHRVAKGNVLWFKAYSFGEFYLFSLGSGWEKQKYQMTLLGPVTHEIIGILLGFPARYGVFQRRRPVQVQRQLRLLSPKLNLASKCLCSWLTVMDMSGYQLLVRLRWPDRALIV